MASLLGQSCMTAASWHFCLDLIALKHHGGEAALVCPEIVGLTR